MEETTRPAATRRRAIQALASSVLLGLLATAPVLAAWPSDKPVRIVIPFAPGGATDLLGRALALELGKSLKQTVIVENKAGAGGGIGAQVVATAPADGYTLLLASASMFTVNPFIYAKLPYAIENFDLISKVASGPMVVTVNAEVPVKSTKELISYAKANPGKVKFSSAGIGSQTHIAGEAFADAAGVETLHIPYKGEGPGYADLMGGAIDMAVGNINAIAPLLKGGRLRALSVTGKERSSLLPNVPTTSEDGLPGFEYTGWFALMAPAGTPKAVVQRLVEDVKLAVAQPGMKRYLDEQGMTAAIVEPDALKSEIEKESAKWKALVAKKNINAN
jgi:tripartite-type tricarboxylate transporter receptor subunit TctC